MVTSAIHLELATDSTLVYDEIQWVGKSCRILRCSSKPIYTSKALTGEHM